MQDLSYLSNEPYFWIRQSKARTKTFINNLITYLLHTMIKDLSDLFEYF